jgi:hypothetical protein
MLFALCSSPLLFVDQPNGYFSMLAISMAVYFATFGLLDAASMFSPAVKAQAHEDFVSPGEIVILVAVLMLNVGFHAVVRLPKPASSGGQIKDWPARTLLIMGLLLWAAGCGAQLYQSLVLITENTNAAVAAGFSKIGIWFTSALILFEVYAGPLGVVLLGYWWTTSSRKAGNVVIAFVVFAQFIAGWVVDTKSFALSPLFIILLTRFFATGRLPVRLLLAGLVGTSLVFPVMTAKRVIMNDAQMSRAQSLSHTWEFLVRAVEHQDEYRNNKYGDATSSFLERSTDKGAVEIFAANIGKTHPYRMGTTLDPLLYVFIPRVAWSGKPGANSAQTFNREFHISADPDTYISPTHMGELYWNFGWPGVVIGMALSGALLGYVAKRFNPADRPSMTSVLVIMVTLYLLVIGRGGSIGTEYVVWLRSMALIGVLHLVFARAVRAAPHLHDADDGCSKVAAPLIPVRFPNLLR